MDQIMYDINYNTDTAEYGQQKGDIGSQSSFLTYKFGDYRRLNAPMWNILYPNSPIQEELYGVRLDFIWDY